MEFMLGCNYWAEHAGTEMWANWNEKVVERDFKRLKENGLKYLRVFPNWKHFQPATGFYGVHNTLREIRRPNGEYFDNPYYLDMEMIKRFAKMCAIAKKYDIKLIVGIVTGWMSGRLFVPPILDGKNIITDPMALELQHKFVKGFVLSLRDEEAIYAWDLGNECNCMSRADTREQAEVWTSLIADTIRAYDNKSRPVISGMHGLGLDRGWTIFDQAQNTDVLTTHPYPHFVEHCYKDDLLSYRTLLHATTESTYYATIGGKPCLVEEIGTLGPCTCDDKTAGAFLRTNLYSNWAHGSTGLLWWCANEQVELKTTPYSWIMMERELGLFDLSGKPRETLKEFKKFDDFLKDFGKELPKVKYDGVCVLTFQHDQWGSAYMSNLLAKQAGVNLAFASYKDVPDSDVYVMPSVQGTGPIFMEQFDRILDRVKKGATLYISNDNGYFAKLEEFSGVHVVNSCASSSSSVMEFNGSKIEFTRNKTTEITSDYAIATEENGAPVFTKYRYGKGTVYFLNFPLESMLLGKSHCEQGDYYRVYEEVFSKALKKRIAKRSNKNIGLTLHEDGENIIAVLINYTKEVQETGFKLSEGYAIDKIYKGNPDKIEANEASILAIKKI